MYKEKILQSQRSEINTSQKKIDSQKEKEDLQKKIVNLEKELQKTNVRNILFRNYFILKIGKNEFLEQKL